MKRCCAWNGATCTIRPINRTRDTAPSRPGFWPRDDPDERFANKQRIRAGIGDRHSFQWRFETLYVWDRSRDSANQGFTTADHALDLRIRRVW